MVHIVSGLLIFIGCTFAVFSDRIHDGLIGRHLLTFAAIAGAGFAYGGETRALLTAYVLLLTYLLYTTTRGFWRLSKCPTSK